MKSRTHEYRVVTAPGGKFVFERQRLGELGGWTGFWSKYETKEEAKAAALKLIEEDNFIPEVVEC